MLLVTMHHIVSDGWSIAVFLREFADLYRAYRDGRGDPLNPLPIQYADYSQWQREWLQGEVLGEQLSYWRACLEGAAPQLELPTDRPRPVVQSYRGRNVEFVLDTQLSADLRAFAQRHEMTLFMVLYAAWAVLLSRLSGQEDVVIGTPVANRQRPELEGLIGFFVNTLVLRLGVRRDLRLKELLEQVKEVTLGAYDHQDVPFEQVVEALQPQRSLSRNPLFQVMFALQNVPMSELRLPGLAVTLEGGVDEPAMFDLLLSLEERGDEIVGSANYAMDLFDRETIERWIACFTVLLRGMTGGEKSRIGDLPILPESERHRVIDSFNATLTAYPKEKLIHELFEEQVQRTPDAIAVVHEEQRLTYAELNSRANQLARCLMCKGVGPDQPVAICVGRCLEMVVGLLGILKSGGAYVPLDPNYPTERLQYMLEDAAPEVVLTQEELRLLLPATQAEAVVLDAKWKEISGYAEENLPAAELTLTAQNLVYVIYTSGSTGRPKATAMAHRSMVNLIEWHRKIFGAGEGRHVLQFAALSFDVAFQETFSTLCTGGTLVLLDEWVRRDARALAEFLSSRSIERIFVPPLMLQSLAECCQSLNAVPACLRDVVTAGEQLRISPEISSFFKRLNGCRLHNHYGPTETHVVTALTLTGDPREWPALPAIGRPISNTWIHVLDGEQQPVPIGVAGEIYIGGAGLARGYLGRSELTSERFIVDPFNADPEARLYRTGDLGRWRADGTLEFLGRNDDQVKVRGYRIELGEIEAQLARHEQVKEAAVVAREGVPGERRLVAYVAQRDQSGPSVKEVHAYLKSALPEYMVPRAFVMLESLPLTPNGKLDRRALPAPEFGAYVSQPYEAPQGEIEEVLAGIWQDLLRVERVGRQDNFFELGGHSLLIVQMKERLRRLGLWVAVRSVYESPTLAALARMLGGDAIEEIEVPPNLIPSGCEAITPEMLTLVDLEPEHIERIVQLVPGKAGNIQDIYPLAPLQEGMLFHYLLNEAGGDVYVVTTLMSLSSRERLEELIAGLQGVIDRHDVLRTAVLWEQFPQPVQVVYRRATLQVEEVQLDSDREATDQIKEWIKPERQRLDLRQAPLMRLQIAEDANGVQWYALLQLHHLAHDHDSMETMFAEVMAYLEGRAQELPEPVPYRNHVAQALAQARTHDAEAFFRGKLWEIDEPTAPFGLLNVHGDGSRIDQAHRALEATLAQEVRAQARRLGVSAATLFHAAWGLVVSHTSGRDDVVYGTLLSGRLQGSAGAQRMLGMFINTLPLRLQLHGVTAKELVEQTQRELVELLNHEQTYLAVAQRCSGVAGSTPLFNALLNYRHSAVDLESEFASAGVTLLSIQGLTNYPINFSVDDRGDAFLLDMETDRRIDPYRMMGYVSTALQSLVEALEQAPQTPALALSILPDGERQQLIQLFNATQVVYPREKLIHELFEEQVQRTPDAVAVIYEEQSLTYTDLNCRSNQLARYLRAKGVGPDRLVGMYVERSVEMVVGLLGVLKAGGAYVPLDVSYPAERLAYILKDSAPVVLLTQERLKKALPASDAWVVALDADADEIGREPEANLDAVQLGLTSRNLSYVIYTSGSTGTPKGVMVEHRSVVNLVHWHCAAFDLSEGYRCSCVAAVGFDAAAWEIWPPLSVGGALVLAAAEATDNPEALLAWWASQPLDVSFLPTPVAELAFSRNIRNAKLRTLLVGGDRLHHRSASHSFSLINNYGPTESTVVATSGRIHEDDTVSHIGGPIANTRIYILDQHRRPAPFGVAGEIYIGGAAVARGYLNRPELTVERFLADPFSGEAQARMYRSGDLGRWRSDGTIEYLGRNDDQVKIRGFRIELGEIEAQLLRHAQVKEAAVLAREDEPGEKRLVAYVVAALPHLKALQQEVSSETGAQIVAQWKRLYEETYSRGSPEPSFVGWNSSYTGQPIPEEQMEEWLAGALERIRALQPKKVLEIGCGVGLLLQHLAPECSVYVGTDFSASALGQLRQWMSRRGDLKHVELLQRSATELQDLESGSFDTVVLNSVVQYFPDIEYLLTVLQEAVRLLGPGGKIFLGDIRHLGRLAMFHSAVQLSKAAATVSVGKLRKRIARAVAQDKELVIDPRFFEMLPGHVPGISAVEVQLKRGRALNELTRYRYDAVLHTGDQTAARAVCESLEWHIAAGSTAELEAALGERRWCAVRLQSIPNSRLAREAAAQKLIETSDEHLEASALRRQLNELQFDEADPEKFWELAQAHGYDVTVSPGEQGFFEAKLLDRARADGVSRVVSPPPDAVKPWSAYANNPLENSFRQQLIPQLRHYLKVRLPEYMIPSAWMVLKELPLTPNGKVDRRALPNPQGRPEEMGEYIAPRNELERTLADIWAQLLQVDQVGVQDNFFELGGHSLLATRVITRIRELLQMDLPLKVLFDAQTVEQLSMRVKSEEHRQAAEEALRMDILARELRQEINVMHDDAVLGRIAELEKELGDTRKTDR